MPLADLSEALDRAEREGFSPSLIEAWSAAVDAEMVARLDAMDLKTLPIRGRIRTAVLTRLEILKPHKTSARKAALVLANPVNAPLAARIVARIADAMWKAAGDTATDFNWYTKRAILGAVYTATEIAWFGDDTPDEAPTRAFLDGRIENVMQFEQLKARLRQACTPERTSAR